MTKPYQEYHLLQLLEGYDDQTLPMDVWMSFYFRSNKALGSKDRAFIAESAYGMVRWRGLLDRLSRQQDWESRWEIYQNPSWRESDRATDPTIPAHTRCSFPKVLYDHLAATHGEAAFELCLSSNTPAPTTVRANALKTTRNALLDSWKGQYEVRATKRSPCGIVFDRKINFWILPEFKKGLFEVQDEASQLVAAMVDAKPGQRVLDYCSGSGGKTLAFAPSLQGKGQIYLHDIRPRALEQAKQRLKRAGIQNGQIVTSDSANLKKMKKKMDWVIVDAPCTGTGTLRRNPDMKWRFDDEMLERLTGQQRTIFEKALSYLAPGGTIVYATCSVLNEENDQQVEHFCKTYGLTVVGEPFRSLPREGKMDGFFAVALKRAIEN